MDGTGKLMAGEWRLLLDGPMSGALNMARDRSLQFARESGDAPPTLRLYRWERPTVSLGRFQDVSGVDARVCAEHGIDVVRRPTGGRGVLHHDELTYSLVASVVDGMPRGVSASYRYISEALAHTYRLLGVDARVTRLDGPASSSPACYLATTRADLAFESGKLSGSAQVWHRDTVLQHGSFTRTRDVELESAVFRLSAGETRALAEHTSTLASITGGVPGFDDIERAVKRAFEETLGVTLRLTESSHSEDRAAEALVGDYRVTSDA